MQEEKIITSISLIVEFLLSLCQVEFWNSHIIKSWVMQKKETEKWIRVNIRAAFFTLITNFQAEVFHLWMFGCTVP